MSSCNHGGGGQCTDCDENINLCCGDGGSCQKCDAEFCVRCYRARKNDSCDSDSDDDSFDCPKCAFEIFDDSDLLEFVLKKYKLKREDIEKQYVKQKLWDTLEERTEQNYEKLMKRFKKEIEYTQNETWLRKPKFYKLPNRFGHRFGTPTASFSVFVLLRILVHRKVMKQLTIEFGDPIC